MNPFVSVIVPAHNASLFLNRCLDALLASDYDRFEIIVVDDGSTDNSIEVSNKEGITVLQTLRRSGPAAARNLGAESARGEILFFVDSDVVVQRATLRRVGNDFSENPEIAAVFGSYDDDPAEKNFLSQYKNLQHHFVHQQSNKEAATFWAGCGAVRREAFMAVGGFDPDRYSRPSIEDIELGYRLRRHGYRILLDKDLQAKHLKKWNLESWLRADILCRAMPWSELILENRGMVNDLNLRTVDRVSAALVGLAAAMIPLSMLSPNLLWVILPALTIVFMLNSAIYGFFVRRRGIGFLILAFPTHLLYYLYSGLTFLFCWSRQLLSARPRR